MSWCDVDGCYLVLLFIIAIVVIVLGIMGYLSSKMFSAFGFILTKMSDMTQS